MTKGLTISTVAQMAGVSKTTVSRYLNGKYEFMSPQTRQRIQDVILKTGYQPNHLAQSLKSRRSMLAGLLVADIESPFSAAAVKAIGDVLGQAGYTLITVDTGGDPKRQQEALDSLVQRQVDGIIVNSAPGETQQLGRIQHSGIPVVLLDRFVGEGGFDIGYLENERPIQALLSHLREQEYGRIALFVQDYAAASPRYLRWKAFLDAAARQGGGVGEPQVYVVDPQRQETLDSALCRLMVLSRGDPKPPAVIAANGVTLMHTVKSIRSFDIRMPWDIGLCGYDDWGWMTQLGLAGLVDVGLTAVAPSVHELGEKTARLLLERMAGFTGEPREICIEAPLVVRRSTLRKEEANR